MKTFNPLYSSGCVGLRPHQALGPRGLPPPAPCGSSAGLNDNKLDEIPDVPNLTPTERLK